MILTIPDGIDPVVLRWEVSNACASIAPDDNNRMLCPEQVWRALITGKLNEAIAENHWGSLQERQKAHLGRTVKRIAMDAAVIASCTDGPWWIRFLPPSGSNVRLVA